MNSRAIALVRSNFRTVTESPTGGERLSTAFYHHLFGANPILRQLFPAGMHSQRERFFAALSYAIETLDDEPRLVGFLSQLGRDHRKYGVESAHYAAAGDAILVAVRDYTGALFWTNATDSAWRSVLDVIVAGLARGAEEDDLPAQWQATVVEHRRVLDDLAIVRLRSDDPVPYEAGQYLPVRIPQRPNMWRYLSPAIPWNPAGEIEFHIRRISGGWVSPSMVNETRIGDVWSFGAPLGGLRVTPDRDVLMVASGTGLAPLRAQIMDMTSRGVNPHVYLFVGGRHPCDLYDIYTLFELGMTNPWLHIQPVTQLDADPWWHAEPPPPIPEGMNRRLTGSLGQVVAGFGSWADRQIQIAGSPKVVHSVRYSLLLRGTPASRITHDPV